MNDPHPALRRHQKAEWIDHSKDSRLGFVVGLGSQALGLGESSVGPKPSTSKLPNPASESFARTVGLPSEKGC